MEYRVRWGREPVRDQRAVGTDCIEIVQESASKDRRYGNPLAGLSRVPEYWTAGWCMDHGVRYTQIPNSNGVLNLVATIDMIETRVNGSDISLQQQK